MNSIVPVRVQRKRTKGFRLQDSSDNGLPVVYVGRPTVYGNDVKIGDKPGCAGMDHCNCTEPCKGMTAEECVQFYRDTTAKWLTPAMTEYLRGKNLACWCPIGQACHADVLLELANSQPKGASVPQ